MKMIMGSLALVYLSVALLKCLILPEGEALIEDSWIILEVSASLVHRVLRVNVYREKPAQIEMSWESEEPVDWAGGQCAYQDTKVGRMFETTVGCWGAGLCVVLDSVLRRSKPLRLWKEVMWLEWFKTIPEAAVEYRGRLSIKLWQDLKIRVKVTFLTAVTESWHGSFRGKRGSLGLCRRGGSSLSRWEREREQPEGEAQLVTLPLHPGSRERCMLVPSCLSFFCFYSV